jgi:hypothetical protein
MAISRFQMNRQLRAYGGIMGQDGRRNYGIGSFFQEKIMDPIKKVVKSPAGLAAAAIAANYAPKFIPGGSDKTLLQQFLPKDFSIVDTAKNVLLGKEKKITGVDEQGNPIFEGSGVGDTQRTGGLLSGLLTSKVGLPLASGLLAGAFTKDKEDPIYTGQDVGLNLQDIGRLANISDPKTASAIGLRFSPDVASRKFTPEEMAASYAANAPVEFTEKREQAEDGGIMGSQKDFDKFLEDMKQRDMSGMQDQILKDFQEYMRRKKMIEQMPEAKNGGIMKMAEGGMMMASDDTNERVLQNLYESYLDLGFSPEDAAKKAKEEFDRMSMKQSNRTMAAEGGMMNMGGMEMDLRGGGFVPMGKAERADDVPARLSKNEFVFTADAVRAAGGGNVDKGADKMYATMKKLEDRVA